MSRPALKAVLATVCAVISLAGCSDQQTGVLVATLYRNSPASVFLRVHVATFDANESDPTLNMDNCKMVSRLLNANLSASTKTENKERDTSLGFWCETGPYREKGSVPSTFPEAFPTGV